MLSDAGPIVRDEAEGFGRGSKLCAHSTADSGVSRSGPVDCTVCGGGVLLTICNDLFIIYLFHYLLVNYLSVTFKIIFNNCF